jgi:hypothetical protein
LATWQKPIYKTIWTSGHLHQTGAMVIPRLVKVLSLTSVQKSG